MNHILWYIDWSVPVRFTQHNTTQLWHLLRIGNLPLPPCLPTLQKPFQDFEAKVRESKLSTLAATRSAASRALCSWWLVPRGGNMSSDPTLTFLKWKTERLTHCSSTKFSMNGLGSEFLLVYHGCRLHSVGPSYCWSPAMALPGAKRKGTRVQSH